MFKSFEWSYHTDRHQYYNDFSTRNDLYAKIFGIESKDCYRFYIDIKRRKNESRTYFLDRMQEKLNERMLRDEEMERLRK